MNSFYVKNMPTIGTYVPMAEDVLFILSNVRALI